MIAQYKTTREVAEELGVAMQSISLYHRKYGIGTKENGRLFFTARDIEEIKQTDGRRN